VEQRRSGGSSVFRKSPCVQHGAYLWEEESEGRIFFFADGKIYSAQKSRGWTERTDRKVRSRERKEFRRDEVKAEIGGTETS